MAKWAGNQRIDEQRPHVTQIIPTIRRKLTALLMAVSVIVLLFSAAASFVFQTSAFRESQARALSAHARIFAQGGASVLSRGDAAALQPLLRALGGDESISAVSVYDAAGNTVAAYSKTSSQILPRAAGLPGQKFEGGRWKLFHPVTQEGRQIGTLYLESDPREFRAAQRRAVVCSALIFTAGIALAYALSARMQRAVSGPVQDIAGAVRRAAEESSYAAALPKFEIEELSALSNGFNGLLGQIRTRDQAVHFTQAEMEQQVMTRTTELSQASQRLQEEMAERRRAEASRETMAAIVENSRDFVCMASMEGAALFINEAGKALLGMTGAPAQLEEMFHEEARKQFTGTVMPAVQQSGSWEGETLLRNAAGKKVPVETSLFIVRDRTTAQPACLAMMARGIQERLNLEAQLRHAQKMEAIGQLAAGVAHDFNNMVTVVRGHAEMLLSSDIPDEDKESVADIMSAAERGGNLTRQLLVFGRKQVIQTQLLNLNDVIAGLRRLLQSLLGDRIPLQCAFCETPALIEGDRTMIEQIMVNLAVNARDAMPREGALHVSTAIVEIGSQYLLTHPQARPGEFCRITVKDFGAGMDPATLSRIFDPFFTTKPPGEGPGLGLSNVYGVALQHRGWIEVESEPGAGTTFRVHLPAVQTKEASSAVLPPPARVEGGDESILVAEDDASLNRLLGSALHRLGYQLHSAPDGLAACQMAENPALKLDLLIADMAMPNGMTGCELALRLRKARPDLRVIITSGYAVNLKEAGAPEDFVFVAKPYEISAMARQARQCLDRA